MPPAILAHVERLIVDGDNLLFALRSHGPGPHVTRLQMVRLIEDYIRRTGATVTVVFDGAPPPRHAGRLPGSRAVTLRFSAPRIADEVIIDMIESITNPAGLRIVTGDRYIQLEAQRGGVCWVESVDFVAELCEGGPVQPAPPGAVPPDSASPGASPSTPDQPDPSEKPAATSRQERDEWLAAFGVEPSEIDAGSDEDDDMYWARDVEPL